ncbi:unnamed protein product, partial [Oikopleura dioica]
MYQIIVKNLKKKIFFSILSIFSCVSTKNKGVTGAKIDLNLQSAQKYIKNKISGKSKKNRKFLKSSQYPSRSFSLQITFGYVREVSSVYKNVFGSGETCRRRTENWQNVEKMAILCIFFQFFVAG